MRTALSPGVVFRDSDLVKDGGDDFHYVISQTRTHLDSTQCDRDLRLGYGDATLMCLYKPGVMCAREDFEVHVIVVPLRRSERSG